MKIHLNFLFVLIFFTNVLSAQLTLKVTGIPSNTPENPVFFVAGNFQGWDPGDTDYQLIENGEGDLEVTFTPTIDKLEFKFTRGSWETVEGSTNGVFLPNRTYVYQGKPDTVEFEILSWEDVGGNNSTAAENVQIFDTDFFMPQLNRTRRIWVYLPPDYDMSNKNYPVLYMHDGQNCFDEATSFGGEWKVDESLNQLFEEGDYGCIVVAIDNGGIKRTDELTPWNPGGEGDQYLQFIVNSLKPVIDATFRTKSKREYTGIMGSSLGGLISHYALIKYQNVFCKAGVFSPAYWIVKDSIFDLSANTTKEFPLKSYTIAGKNEGGEIPEFANEMHTLLLNNGFSEEELFKKIHSDGQHREWYWAREFPVAYKWLFGNLNLTATTEIHQPEIEIFPNPSNSVLNFKNLEKLDHPFVEVVALNGKIIVQKTFLKRDSMTLPNLSSGIYIVKVWDEEKVIFSQKWLRN